MKKLLSVLLVLALCITPMYALLAVAETSTAEDSIMLSATVQAKTDIAIKAPASGELLPFTLQAGDGVTEGEWLFGVEAQTVYADIDGTIASVYISSGDVASTAMAIYGSVMQIEFANRYELYCNTNNGYDSNESKNLYVGTPVYLREKYSTEYTAEGQIVSVNGRNFTVAIDGGDLRYDETINVYSDADYTSKNLLSSSSLSIIDPYQLSGTGTIVEVFVQRGDEVAIGDALFSYVPDVLEPENRGQIDALNVTAETDLVIQSVSVTQGASVQKGQVLAMAKDLSDLELVAMVEERDLAKVEVGQVFYLSFDEVGMSDLTATVASISPMGTTSVDLTEYQVTFDFEQTEGILIGMHATLER